MNPCTTPVQVCRFSTSPTSIAPACLLLCVLRGVLQWVGRTLAASVGLGLVLVQVLSHYNVITVNWSVVHQQARQVLDSTGDG